MTGYRLAVLVVTQGSRHMRKHPLEVIKSVKGCRLWSRDDKALADECTRTIPSQS